MAIKKPNFGLQILILLFICSCKEGEESVQETLFLGTPKVAQMNARFIPKNWIAKQFAITGDSSSTEGIDSDFFNLISPNTPSIKAIATNLIKLEPDLSKNWVVSAGVFGNTQFVSCYFKIAKPELIETLLVKSNIKSSTQEEEINILQIDEKTSEHHYLIFDKDHLLILKTKGNQTDSDLLIQSTIYSSKSKYIACFDSIFDKKRNDLDIRIRSNISLVSEIKIPLLHDLAQNFDGSIQLNVLENQIDLQLNPNLSLPILDSIFTPIHPIEEEKASFQTHLNLKFFKQLLLQYDYLDDIEYELQKGKLNYKTLSELTNGRMQISYNGTITRTVKSISYAFDENFNEIEKTNYTHQKSYDCLGEIGSKNPQKTIQYLSNKNYISKTKNNTYEPIIGSKSKIYTAQKAIKIGGPTTNGKNKTKLLLSFTDPNALPLPKEMAQINNQIQCSNARLELDNNNQIILLLNFDGSAYNYLKKAWEYFNPKI